MSDHVILVTNDDGVNAPGLMALKDRLAEVARVEVFVPERNWSAAGRTRTFHKPLRLDEVRLLDGTLGHVTNGTPSDCISLALLGLLKTPPDLIVSGINPGLNTGQDMTQQMYMLPQQKMMMTVMPGSKLIWVLSAKDLKPNKSMDFRNIDPSK